MSKTPYLGCALFFGMASVALGAQVGATSASSPPAASESQKSAASSQEQSKTGGLPGFDQRRPRYRLAPGDGLNLVFPFSPEFDQAVTVQPDGFITLKEIGDFYAQGKTAPELRDALAQAYAGILNRPVVTVDLKDFQKPYFIAGGEVGHPGKYDLREDTTTAAAIAIAGGFTPSSKHSQVLLFRRVSDNTVEVKRLNMKKMLNTANLQEDVFLRPGDMLFVPKNRISKISRYIPTEALSLYFSPLSY